MFGVTEISIHAPHEGERRNHGTHLCQHTHFNPRSPRGGATVTDALKGEDTENFNPRSPREGATPYGREIGKWVQFQSTLPTRGSDSFDLFDLAANAISIHAPHEGERPQGSDAAGERAAISIHAPHEGERRGKILHGFSGKGFQSTLPTRGSDKATNVMPEAELKFQSTLPTRGSDHLCHAYRPTMAISIHAPHEGERR